MHASRFERYGDPHVTKHRANGTAMRYLRETVLIYAGHECLIWPFDRVGKGQAYIRLSKTERRYVGPWICEQLYGPAPSPEHEAAHSCGKGHLACVTPRHLRWATRADNREDMIAHGTRYRGSRHHLTKLTEADIPVIRALLREGLTQREIGARFGVSEDVIGFIKRGVSWAWVR
jgi:hypothetical protein